ncbi:hypothetical protein CDG79_39090 [Nostoc sp. 'Peltigera membranacea cyanobiont' 232]|nr:hypothetical protein CDG79_39090 [Nostoc sp. 'Peltigera membranacea cyanobiont' 232]
MRVHQLHTRSFQASIKRIEKILRIHTISFWKIYGSLLSYVLLGFSPVNAQITPDKTLLINSQLTHHSNTSIIEGGTIKGSNLFHSFEQFSVLPGTTAYFNNGISIQNIFTRVTGNSISNIDGILKANGTANFFLINPNGIIFGQHAQLNVGSSFFASTANTIKFSDGFEFKANVSQTTPLLTISTPIGLIIGNDSGAIQVIGTGLGLITQNSPVSPIIRNNDLKGLQVKPSKTLDLVGGDITLEGANITAEQGRIELGSVGDGIVSLRSNGQGWILNFEQVSSFKKISISQQSLIDASGNAGGSITVQAKDVSLENSSIFLIQNHDLPAGSINIKASNSFQLTGASTDGKFVSLLQTESLGSGKGADINISTNNLIAQQGASIEWH